MMLHFLVLGSFELAYLMGWTRSSLARSVLTSSYPEWQQEPPNREVEIILEEDPTPETFFDADPSMEDEKPEQADYYAVVDALAGDPDPTDEQDQPALEGDQEKVPKAASTLQPAPAEDVSQAPIPDEPSQETTQSPFDSQTQQKVVSLPENSESTDQKPADAMVEEVQLPLEPESVLPADHLVRPKVVIPETPKPKKVRPRPKSLAEARKRNGMLAGDAMKQEGGMDRFRMEASPDLMSTPFGAYDATIIQAIQQRWFALLDGTPSARSASGKVLLNFDLMADGSIANMSVVEDTVGVIQSLLCQRAVLDPQPYGKWPSDMRRMIGDDQRKIRFTFYYN
jgi:outer membrane biosynthesis protein TonB